MQKKSKELNNNNAENNEETQQSKLKHTLFVKNLAFPTRVNLVELEKKIIKHWEKIQVYEQIQQKNKGNEFILHDGPPFTNGELHLGHALNKALKSIVLFYNAVNNKAIEIITGHDCHGLPIENKIVDLMKNDLKITDSILKNLEKILEISDQNIKINIFTTIQTQLESLYFKEEKLLVEDLINKSKTLDNMTFKYLAMSTKKVIANKLSIDNIDSFFLKCEQFSRKWIENHRNAMKSMGFLMDKKFYTTLDSAHDIYKVFSDLIMLDLAEIKKKPILFSFEEGVVPYSDIKYQEKTSKSIYVGLDLYTENVSLKNAKIIIWTTTPWSLMDNTAVAFNRNINYNTVLINDNLYILAQDCLEDFKSKLNSIINFKIINTFSGSEFEKFEYFCESPLIKGKKVPLIYSDHVDNKTGTGFVHIAPAHGPEDFALIPKYKIDILDFIDDNGYYMSDSPVEELRGKHIFNDENFILQLLDKKLILVDEIKHNCAFSRKDIPVIYKTSTQIFINLFRDDTVEYMKKSLELCSCDWSGECDYCKSDPIKHDKKGGLGISPNDIRLMRNVKWIPRKLGREMLTTLSNRKEWVFSRNRKYGVPLAVFYNKNTLSIYKNQELQNEIMKKIKADPIYFLKPESKEFINKYVKNPEDYEVYLGTFDVWGESGSLPRVISAIRDNSDKMDVSDFILEGKDQIRGWFQVLLLLGLLTKSMIPYKAVLSHGHIMAGKNEKMSKSKGNFISFDEIINQHGNEILRTVFCFSDFKDDVIINRQLFEKTKPIYVRIRRIMSFLVSNAKDYEFNDLSAKKEGLEKYALTKLLKCYEEYKENMNNFEIHQGFMVIYNYLLWVSSIYFNSRKPILYTENSDLKQSILHTIYIIFVGCLLMLTPFFPFTMEELFLFIKKDGFFKDLDSVFLIGFDYFIKLIHSDFIDVKLMEKLDKINLDPLRQEIEKMKQSGEISRSGEIICTIPAEYADITNEIRFILNCNSVKTSDKGFSAMKITAPLCDRCWLNLGTITKRIKLENNLETVYICESCEKYL